MTLAAVCIEPAIADQLLTDFRRETGLGSELKGSRIDLDERALFFDLFERSTARAMVGVAISAVKPALGEDRGDHDQLVYAALLDDAVAALLPKALGCTDVIIDDGRYDQATLAPIRTEIARLIGPCGLASLELSHRSAGLQIADVIANTFFNRALVSPRQGRMADAVAPFLESGKIEMRVLDPVG
jgi:hypothetical protein